MINLQAGGALRSEELQTCSSIWETRQKIPVVSVPEGSGQLHIVVALKTLKLPE